MASRADKGRFAPGVSGNPGGRPKLPAEIKEMFQAKGPEALEVLTRCLQSDGDRIALLADHLDHDSRLHDSTIIEALQSRGLVDRPRIDSNGKYIPPALTALGRTEVEQRDGVQPVDPAAISSRRRI